MFASHHPVLSPGALILVTGVSGFIGSHIADLLLDSGYRVRGTTRDAIKNAWVTDLFENKYGQGQFELCAVPDMTHQNAFDSVLEGISGVIHTASDMTFGADPNQIIPPMVASSIVLAKAAAKAKSVDRFVYTSSCAAAASPKRDTWPTITHDTWNDEAMEQAWAPPPYEPERGFTVYAASKAQSEKELWKLYNEMEKPPFVLNTVLPSMNMGKSLNVKNQGHPSTSALVQAVFQGDHATVQGAHQYFHVDVQDTARLHLAALLHPEIQNERIFAYATPYTWRGIQMLIQNLYPGKTFVPDIPEVATERSEIVMAPRAEALLKEMGRGGWTTLEESVRLNTEDL